MEENYIIKKVNELRKQKGRGLRFKLERVLLIMQFKRYCIYKTFQKILKQAEQQKLPLESSYIQLSLRDIFEEISLDKDFSNRTFITPALIESAFQKFDVFIKDCQTALEKAK